VNSLNKNIKKLRRNWKAVKLRSAIILSNCSLRKMNWNGNQGLRMSFNKNSIKLRKTILLKEKSSIERREIYRKKLIF